MITIEYCSSEFMKYILELHVPGVTPMPQNCMSDTFLCATGGLTLKRLGIIKNILTDIATDIATAFAYNHKVFPYS